MVKLGVNIDHIATLRQARKEGIPDIVKAAREVKKGGADSITVHLRLDRRHINDEDVCRLSDENILPLNLEMAADDEIIEIALQNLPESVCIVPEKRQELTTEGGLDVEANFVKLKDTTRRLKDKNIQVSFFIDPLKKRVQQAAKAGADTVELHTGSYANAKGSSVINELEKIKEAAREVLRLGLNLNAGHGLNYDNVTEIKKIPSMNELNIGYSIVCRSIFTGLKGATNEMVRLLR